MSSKVGSLGGPGRIEISVGVPTLLTQLMNGKLMQRLLTLAPVSEFYSASGMDKLKIIAKTALVGLISLGIAASVALMSSITIYAIPLCLIATMGLSFNFLNEEAAEARKVLPQIAVESMKAGRNVTLKPEVIVIE